MDLKEAAILGDSLDSHWYYTSKGRALLQMLNGVRGDSVLDVGAGSGIFARQLLDAGICQRAVCVDTRYPNERVEQYNDGEIRFTRKAGRVKADIVLMMDVLEHVDDDVGLLKDYAKNLRPEDRLVITVPAFQFLWSGHDEFLEHRRRYTRRQLESAVRAANLEPMNSGYFFGLLFPIAAAQRLIDRWLLGKRLAEPRSLLSVQSKALNTALIALHDVERKFVFPFNRIGGLSVFCVARRPAAHPKN